MTIRGVTVTLSISALIAAGVIYVAFPVPTAIKQRDQVFWIFAKRKVIRGLSILGEILGIGHRLALGKSLGASRLLAFQENADYTNVKMTDATFDGVPVRIHEPLVGRSARGPALVWLHGGGWVQGSAESDEFLTTELTRRLGIVIVSVNYRLAPEFLFPVPFDDCFKAVVHLLNNAETLDVDPRRIAVGGASAGANLAAAVSLKIRDLHLTVRPVAQVLIVPCLQAFDFHTPSYQQNWYNGFLPAYHMVNYWLWYAHGFSGHHRTQDYLSNQHTSAEAKSSPESKFVDHQLVPRKSFPASYVPSTVDSGNATLWSEIRETFLNPYFAPLMAKDLKDLPDAYVATGEWDVLRDDGVMYAKRLAAEGEVNVEHDHYEHGYHHLFIQRETYETSRLFIDHLCDYLSRRL